MNRKAVSKLRAKARRANRQQHALFALLQQTTKKELEQYQRNQAFLGSASANELQSAISRMGPQITALRKRLGMKFDADLPALLGDITGGPAGTILFIPKSDMLAMCRNYTEVIPELVDLPSHTLVGIEDGAHRTEPGRYSLYLPEAQAFEDLAALHNEAQRRWSAPHKERDEKSSQKTLSAVCRWAIIAGYGVVEGYLNGLAFDFLAQPSQAITAADRQLLEERNSKGKIKFTSFETKLLQYPRIVSPHPVATLSADADPHLAELLAMPKLIRDAIVHRAPRNEHVEYGPGVAVFLAHVEFPAVVRHSRAVVKVIRMLEALVHGNEVRLWWLKDLETDERFPEQAFE